MGKLENLLSFDDFDKSWSSKKQKSTKHTEVGVDVLNENLYTKVMDQTSPKWEQSVKQFVTSINKAIKENQVKDIEVDGNVISFTLRGRKHKLNKDAGSMTLFRIKATVYRDKKLDDGGRLREDKKKKKKREEIQVTVPIGKEDASSLFKNLKLRAEAEED